MTESLIEYGDSNKKIEKRVKEFLMILLACSDYPIKVESYSDIDNVKKANDYDTVYTYEEMAEKILDFDWRSMND